MVVVANDFDAIGYGYILIADTILNASFKNTRDVGYLSSSFTSSFTSSDFGRSDSRFLFVFSRFERSRSSTTTTTRSSVGARSRAVFSVSLSLCFCVEVVVPCVGEKVVVDTSSTRGGRHMSSAYFFAISTKSSTHLFGIKSNKLASILPPPSGTFTAFKISVMSAS